MKQVELIKNNLKMNPKPQQQKRKEKKGLDVASEHRVFTDPT